MPSKVTRALPRAGRRARSPLAAPRLRRARVEPNLRPLRHPQRQRPRREVDHETAEPLDRVQHLEPVDAICARDEVIEPRAVDVVALVFAVAPPASFSEGRGSIRANVGVEFKG
eukprot:30838-Pelagococcus_subviridis.AAC.1